MPSKGYVAKTIGIKLRYDNFRYDNFKSVTRDQTMASYTADTQTTRHAAGLCLKRVPLDQRLRLLGVRMGALIKAEALDPTRNLDGNRPAAPNNPSHDAIDSIARTDQLF